MKTPVLVEISNADSPAFPTTADTQCPGLTKREYIAAGIFNAQLTYSNDEIEEMARTAVLMADALLLALEPVDSADVEPDQ